jgi:predicted esterase YcpF (UPF0227 family)
MRTTIVYLHGFNSSPGSIKARKLARAAAALPTPPQVYIPQLHHQPARAMREVCSWLDERNASDASNRDSLAFVGSSLGGFYATWLAERYAARAIVINPAVRPFESLAAFRGPQRNPYTGEAYELTSGHFNELRSLAIERITWPSRYFLLMRAGDELLDWREPVAYYAGAWQFVAGGGDHGWEDIDAELPSILRFAGADRH